MLLIWHNGEHITVDVNQPFFIGQLSSDSTVFGEHARFLGETIEHYVFETESGAIVKTERLTLNPVGKAAKDGYFVSLGKRNNYIHKNVQYWNEEKQCFETE